MAKTKLDDLGRVRVSLRLPKAMRAKLERVLDDDGRDLAEWLRALIADKLEKIAGHK